MCCLLSNIIHSFTSERGFLMMMMRYRLQTWNRNWWTRRILFVPIFFSFSELVVLYTWCCWFPSHVVWSWHEDWGENEHLQECHSWGIASSLCLGMLRTARPTNTSCQGAECSPCHNRPSPLRQWAGAKETTTPWSIRSHKPKSEIPSAAPQQLALSSQPWRAWAWQKNETNLILFLD